jgi:hypothetical protein
MERTKKGKNTYSRPAGLKAPAGVVEKTEGLQPNYNYKQLYTFLFSTSLLLFAQFKMNYL